MGRMFVKPLFNVKMNTMAVERTTLKVEEVERRFGTGRGYCVTAYSEQEALHIAVKYQRQRKHSTDGIDNVQLIEHRGVPVLIGCAQVVEDLCD